MPVTVEKRIPSVEEFNYLRKAAGWPLLSDDLTKQGLANSVYAVCVMDNGNIVGMGRIVGDNAIYFHISDVIIHPDHQGKKLGKTIMIELMLFIEGIAGQNSNIGLMCSKGREYFYEAFGFVKRPNERFGAGMIKIVE